MGKVQKKANEKHKLSLSPALTEFIDQTTCLPLSQLPSHFLTFPSRWPFPRGDLYNWVGVLDRFDEILQNFNKAYGLSDGPQKKPFGTEILLDGSPSGDHARLQDLGFGDDGDRVLIESILAFSRLLLEKFGNRTLYNSTDRLNELLNTTSLSLLHETLRLTLALAQRFAERGPQAPGHAQFYHFELDKLQKLASPLPRSLPRKAPLSPVKTPKQKDKTSQPKIRRAPTTADPNDFLALARQPTDQSTSNGNTQELDWAPVAGVRVVWSDDMLTAASRLPASRPTTSDLPSSPTPLRQQQAVGSSSITGDLETGTGQASTENQSGLQHIELAAPDLVATTIEDLLQRPPGTMPAPARYELLHKLRIAYGLLVSDESRNLLLQIRLTALCVVSQIYNEEELSAKYFDGDNNASVRQQLVQQLVDLLREPKQTRSGASLYVQSLAMETLAILSRFRQMSTEVLSALSPNSSHGLLLSMVQRGLADIAQDGDTTDNDAGDDWRHAIFMMWTVFMSQSGPHNTRSTEQYVHKNLISAYASGLTVVTGKSLRVHVLILKFLENLFHHFKDGLQVLNANGAFTIACDTTDKLAKLALELCQSGNGIPDQWKTPGMDFKIPYMHQYVLRELVGLVKDISKHQGGHADRALRGFVDSSNLLTAYRLILSHMGEFGAHTWSEVVTAVCGFLNNEPTSYTVVSEAGIISTLLSTAEPQPNSDSSERQPCTISAVPSEPSLKLPAIADVITNLATSFSAICLTEAGHKHFVASNVLQRFFELFESPEHVKAIKESSTLVQLGSTFDELVRHHPGLKNMVISSVVTMIARVRHICRVRMKLAGSGPKLWVNNTAGMLVDGGVDALMAEDIPAREGSQLDFTPIQLPNKDILESGSSTEIPSDSLASSASDRDTYGLTVLDYARPVVGFLAAFLDSHYLCKELMNAGATDLILDFVTLSTLPVEGDAFSDGLLIQDLTGVIRAMSDEAPYLVLPLLIDRATYICESALSDFIDYEPDHLRCYFGRFLEKKDEASGMEVDLPYGASTVHGTGLVRGLMKVYCISRVLADVFTGSSYPSRAAHNSVLSQLNLSDALARMIVLFGKLSAACCREEISLLALMPQSWLDATRPGQYSTGDTDVDAILDVSGDYTTDTLKESPSSLETQQKLKEVEGTAAFVNLQTLRYLLTETPASLSTLFSRIGSSFGGRKKPETFIKQKVFLVCDALAQALISQLDPSFISTAFSHENPTESRDWRFKYFTVVLSRLRDSLWEESNSVPGSAIRQSYVVECFRRADGMNIITKIGTEFFEELKQCHVEKPVFVANTGLKICLEFFNDITHNDLIQSAQTTYMKNLDVTRPFYFNPNQLLLEVRMESLPLTRIIWDSEYAEQASSDVVRKLTAVLRHTLRGENEDGVISRVGEYPKAKAHEKRKFDIDRTRLDALKDKGYDQDLAEEALYRCNVMHSGQMQHAEEYCKAILENPRRRRIAVPSDSTKFKGETPTSQVTSPPAVINSVTAPTATILEDSSQDEDAGDALEFGNQQPINAVVEAGVSQEGIGPVTQAEASAPSAMNISSILNETQQLPSPSPVQPPLSKEIIDAERESIRDQLAERCNNILSNHPNLIFDLNDLLAAGAAKLSEDAAMSWWESATDLLVVSLLSQNIDETVEDGQGKKVAATAHLLGLLCSNDTFKPSMLKVLQENVNDIIEFLRIPAQKAAGQDSCPWIAPVLLIVEKMLAIDAEPQQIKWTTPTDLNTYNEPVITREIVVEQTSKERLFQRLMDILPKVGKDRGMALSIVRTLLILTRDRPLALLQGERRNLQKLFLMVKQLGGATNARFEGAFITVLRHVIEDDTTIKQIMSTEITAYFRSKTSGRLPDLTNYLRELNYLALRSPALFVETSNEKIKLAPSWIPSPTIASAPLALRETTPGPADGSDPPKEDKPSAANEGAKESIEEQSTQKTKDEKMLDTKVPVIEHPDGVIHFLLSELLSYKDVEDKASATQVAGIAKTDEVVEQPAEDSTTENIQSTTVQEKSEKPRYKADEHPIFVYRCFLMHCLTELLGSYNQTKIEFISFSRKAVPMAATPSKARSGVLNYLLNGLVSSGYVDKDESITCRKGLTTSEWAMKVIVALCTKTGESGLGSSAPSRYSSSHSQIEDNGTELGLAYVRRFVLDHAIKVFKDTCGATDSLQIRYARLLCLSDLFNQLISKPAGLDGSVFSNNDSYKRLARLMLEKNFIAVLTAAISDIDLSFPGAKKVVKFILRPLKELTATATDLNLNSPDEFPQIIDQTTADNVSSASSEVSDIDDDREETPDLYRNSALGMLDPARQNASDSDDDDDEGEEMDYNEYDDEMDYDDGMPAPVNDGEVVSDEELEDAIDGPGSMEGLPGDVPMDIEFVVDHHHHHHHDGDDDDTESSSDDDDEDTEDDDHEDIEIEMDDEDGEVEHDDSEGHSDQEGDDGWEDEDGEDAEEDEEDEGIDYDEEELAIAEDDPNTAHFSELLRALGDPDLGASDLPHNGEVVLQTNDPDDPDDDEDQDDDGEDIDDNEGMDYDQPFDMMLDGPDYDENDEWGWEEQPPPPVFRRSRYVRAVGGGPPFFARRIVGMNDHEMHHHLLGPRHHRHAPSGRNVAEDGTNPLLQRPPNVSSIENEYAAGRGFGMSMPARSGLPRGPPFMMTEGPGGPAVAIPVGADLLSGGMGGHGAILDAVMDAIQNGDRGLLQNGRIQLNINGPMNELRELLRTPGGPPLPTSFASRAPREDPQRSAQFVPMLTITRWSEEARILYGKHVVTKCQSIQTWVYATLVPSAQHERKLAEERKAQAEVEREAQRKAEEERLRKEEEERVAKEKVEAEERTRAEATAREAAAAESQPTVADTAYRAGDEMEGIQTVEEEGDSGEPSEQTTRRYTTIRGRQLDITGLDIDTEYLEALPEDLREEVITAQYQARREQAQEQGNDDSAIDQEFLDALPEDIREEIRAQEAAAQRRRDRERARREAQPVGVNAQPADIEPDDFLAGLDPALRRAILAEQPPEILNALNPQHAAEGRAHARSMLFHRLPMQRELDSARGRRELAQRDLKRQQLVQLIDKAGVATLLRLMFLQQHGSLKQNLLHILSQVCGNRQTRYEVVSLLLVILKEGSTDVTAIERSLASLSLRAKATGIQKTPQPLKRTLSIQPYAGLSEDITPILVVQQCLHTLSHICRQNAHVKSLFLREVDVTSANKAKSKARGKAKEARTTTHPVNDLISLLDRRLIMDNSGCLLSLASLLATVTSPLASLMKQEKERKQAEKEQEGKPAQLEAQKGTATTTQDISSDVPMEDVLESETKTEPNSKDAMDLKDSEQSPDQDSQSNAAEKKKAFEPPSIIDHNLKLITNIFVAPECGNDTFRFTLETLQSLSHIPETSPKFGKELMKHVHTLSQAICSDLDDLFPAIKDAQSSTDVQGAAAAKFSATTSGQVKLLRVLQALDYLSAPKNDDETSDDKVKSILTMSYESLGLSSLWTKLGECLTAVEEKGDTISFANILLPLIESLMVVCKHTTLKDAPVQVKEAIVTSPIAATHRDDLEELFFRFTSEHRKILNDIVRQTPKLMQGHFSILVKNSKVLDFDNKRNYFNKQIHSRHHAQRHPQPPLQLNVRRDQVFIDSYKALYFKSAEEMKYGKLNIRFNGEEGVDAGGVTREWFQVLARGMFNPDYALFQPVASDKTTFHPNPLSRVNDEHLLYFKFIGRIIGKALHEGRVLDCHFSRAVYKRILGKKPNLKDLENNDVDYYKSLTWILENDITDILTEEFCVIEDAFGEEKVIDLIPDGRNIAVTEENKKEYVQALVEYRLTESIKEQLDSFLGGFHDIIPAELIAIFNEQELELLISGLPEIDVDDWKANTEYHNYNPSSQQIVWFWRIVKAMTNEERAKLLQFITGTSKVPLNGFKELEGVSGLTKSNIHKDPSTNRLPTSHTCFNQLDLPAYESFEIMKQNITTAISLGADYFGFA